MIATVNGILLVLFIAGEHQITLSDSHCISFSQ